MIYGQDEPMLFPVADLYDSGMMQMYIDAAKEQYNLNREDMKEFMKEYGDFMSPFANDIAWVDQLTRGRINDAMRYMQENGIDPLRSAEGRAIILNVINTTDRAGINTRKANAALGEEYLKARGLLAAKGLYNAEYEKWLLALMGLPDFEHFDSSMGSWTRTSPAQYTDLNTNTSPWFDKLTPGYLYTKDGYDYIGIKDEDLQAVLAQQMPDFVNSDYGKYQYELARRQLVSAGNPEPSTRDVIDQLSKNIVAANRELTARPTRNMNEAHKMALDYSYDIKKQNNSYAHLAALQKLKFILDNSVLDENGNIVPLPYGGMGGLMSPDSYQEGGFPSMSTSGRRYAGGVKSPSGVTVAPGGHSHIGETLVNATTQAAKSNFSDAFLPGFSAGLIKKLLGAINRSGENGLTFMNLNSVNDSPGTIANIFPGRKFTALHTTGISSGDSDRLYTADAILSFAYGTNNKSKASYKPIMHSVGKVINSDRFNYGMLPTGKIKSVLCKDGRVRVYAEMNIYQLEKDTKTGKAIGSAKKKTTLWYDTHITTVKNQLPKRSMKVDENTGIFNIYSGNNLVATMQGKDRGARSDGSSRWYLEQGAPDYGYFDTEQLDLSIDPQYALEVESMDINVNKLMGDKSDRTNGGKFNHD